MENQTYDNTETFSFKNKKLNCKILDIYDGDTITICFFLQEFNYIKMNVRLNGIDTPELKGNTKDIGINARNYLIKLLLNIDINKINIDINKNLSRKEIRKLINYYNNNNILLVEFGDFDKYGRPLVTLYKNNVNINQKMIEDGYANLYNGGTKQIFK